MKAYDRHLEEYRSYPFSSFSSIVPANEWGDKALASAYLEKYWLDEQEYHDQWKSIQERIFDANAMFPARVFKQGFEMIALRGGCLFMEDDFLKLQRAAMAVGDQFMVVIQHSQEFTMGEPMFSLKFPVDITWDELSNGNYISAVLLEMGYNNYFVFGESGSWGKYAANDYEFPLDIIGYQPELAPIFLKAFEQSMEEKAEIHAGLPEEYRKAVR
jgi:hypothetical protein